MARIEAGGVDPRFGTLQRLLDSCGETLVVTLNASDGVDMSQVRSRLKLTPAERLQAAVVAMNNVQAMLRDRRPGDSAGG